MKTTKHIKIKSVLTDLMILIVIFGMFIIGYIVGFSEGKTSALTLNKYVSESQDYIFSCNDWSEPYYSCNSNLKFMNITGLYCDDRLVCQNHLREVIVK